jgi:hypothetical protein
VSLCKDFQPSASGWIDKFLMNKNFRKNVLKLLPILLSVRETGFIYGHIISFDTVNAVETKGWFKEEILKWHC